jgi:hypothetical protein
MKFTDRYIKMCEKATEIQKEWEPHCGDWYYIGSSGDNFVEMGIVARMSVKRSIVEGINQQYDRGRDNIFWLPLQHQLQQLLSPAMLDDSNEKKYDVPWDFIYHLWGYFLDDMGHWGQFETMDEAFLALVMLEVYDHDWDDERGEWV